MTGMLAALTAGPALLQNANRWLCAHDDPLAGIYTFSSCLALSDLSCDGDSKLIVADLGNGSCNMKLRVYKGTQLISENALIDLPTGAVAFHMDQNEPRIPAIAVASGSHIYIYKNLKPYFKFTLPSLDVHHVEKELWTSYQQKRADQGSTSAPGIDRSVNNDLTSLCEGLQSLRMEIGENNLTPRSQRLLMIADKKEGQAFADHHKSLPLKRQTVVTCISNLKKCHSEENSVSCLVLGTESSTIYILDPEAFTIIESMHIPSPPVHLCVSGLYDVDFRLVITCRNGDLCTLKQGAKSAKVIAQLDSLAVGIVKKEKTIWVGTMDECLVCYSTKGKILWQQKMSAAILCLQKVDITSRGRQFVAVSLANHQVLLFDDKRTVDRISLNDPVSAMTFGQFGREENALVMVTKAGGLITYILKRTAQFEEIDSASQAGNKLKKLDIPKKTKLYVDQTLREREHSVSMHRKFQHDLYLLRLHTARAFVHSINTTSYPVSTNQSDETLKMSAKVLGLGPMFRIVVGLCNTSQGKPSRNLLITFYCDEKLYRIHQNLIRVPMLIPGLEYNFTTQVESVSDFGISDQIRVFVDHDWFPPNSLSNSLGASAGSFSNSGKPAKKVGHQARVPPTVQYLETDIDKKTSKAHSDIQEPTKYVSSRPLISAIINMPISETI